MVFKILLIVNTNQIKNKIYKYKINQLLFILQTISIKLQNATR